MYESVRNIDVSNKMIWNWNWIAADNSLRIAGLFSNQEERELAKRTAGTREWIQETVR